ncbi:MAG: UDP-N-acetylmuramate--L-alanine ligase [Bacteroidales bacterium]|nr:UDP-N-acetylmuramate--L-alanine ligase [Bacteroidales bacterium]
MSALARHFHQSGKIVSGYDKTESPLTGKLQTEGIQIHFEEKDSQFLGNSFPKDKTLVIYTPAIPKENRELIFFQARNYTILKRAEILGLICKDYQNIAVAGSHGKTTISTLLAHLLAQSPVGCNAFLGGISNNYDTNYLYSKTSQFVVTEADEYDRSFLQLNPHIEIITAVDLDHLDIYHDEATLLENFQQFANQLNSDGTLILNHKLKDKFSLPKKTVTYGLTPTADFWSEIVDYQNSIFSFHTPTENFHNLQLGVPGDYNIENTTAALTALYLENNFYPGLKDALSNFRGNQRRFDIRFRNSGTIYIDDYAHHPRELEAIINAVKKLFPDKKVLGIFQPHLFSRTKDLADDFAKVLNNLDELVLLEIYPAREKPIPGITSEWLLEKINLDVKQLLHKNEIIPYLSNRKNEIILTLGAGNIDRLVPKIEQLLTLNFSKDES